MLSSSAAHLFVADLATPEPQPEDRHHLERVLRLRPGEPVSVSDGAGGMQDCVWAGGDHPLEVTGPRQFQPAPTPPVTIAFALTKGEKPEWVVQKLTEVGVDVIVPFRADRSIARWDDVKAQRQRDRLVTVARQAAMQSRRAWLPLVEPVSDFGAVAARPGAVLADRGGDRPSLERPVVLIGPEGGWSDTERNRGLPTVSLGKNVLRAETAAMAAGLLFCTLRAGLMGYE